MTVSRAPIAVASPSATVVLLRDAPSGLEVLLLRRNERIAFHGGEWVFPGGRVDDAEAVDGSPYSLEAGRRAAVRETLEESGVALSPEALVPVAHWTTPEHMPKRFATWFFAAAVPRVEVSIDRGEITAHRWTTPREALAARDRGEIGLPPPTFVTLLELAAFERADGYLEASRLRDPPRILPRYRDVDGGHVSLLPGDVAYEGGPLDRPGPRNRIWLLGSKWRFERRG